MTQHMHVHNHWYTLWSLDWALICGPSVPADTTMPALGTQHGSRPRPRATDQGAGPWPWAQGHRPGLGHGPGPRPRVTAQAKVQGHGGHSPALGPGPQTRPQGHGLGPWPRATAQGHDHGILPLSIYLCLHEVSCAPSSFPFTVMCFLLLCLLKDENKGFCRLFNFGVFNFSGKPTQLAEHLQ